MFGNAVKNSSHRIMYWERVVPWTGVTFLSAQASLLTGGPKFGTKRSTGV